MLEFGTSPVSYQKWLSEVNANAAEWDRTQSDREGAASAAQQAARVIGAAKSFADGLDLAGVRNKFAEQPGAFFKAWDGGPTNESGSDLNYFQGYRDTAAEAAGQVIPLDYFIYADAKGRNFAPFGNYQGDWAFRQRVVRAYWDQPAFGGKYASTPTGLETTVANENAGLADYQAQQSHGSDGIGSMLGIVGAIAAVVTGGLSLVGSLAPEAAAAGWVSAEGGIGYAGGAAADALAAPALSTTLSTVKSAYSVASGLNTLGNLGTTPATSRPAGTFAMANPLYLVNQDTAATNQAAAPQTPGQATAAPAAGLPFGLTTNGLAMVALLAVAAYAFLEKD